MRILKADLLQVAAQKKQYPPSDVTEIAFAGRSNVGKSSLINLLCNRKDLARVSGTPGKTRTINFYSVTVEAPEPLAPDAPEGEKPAVIRTGYRIVDLPGYGYAKVSKTMSADWGEMIETYLADRPNLVKVALLVDSRHEPSAQDIQMYDYLRHYGMDGLVVATKADKLSRSELPKNLSAIRKTLGMKPCDAIFPVSALKRTGTDQLLTELERLWRERK